ncbi:acid protease [Suillus decipiens]|nr:acid protease [Suillus decipiens]
MIRIATISSSLFRGDVSYVANTRYDITFQSTMFPTQLLTLLVLSITESPVKAANSPTSVPITSRLNFSNGTYNLVAHDRAHLQALRDHSKLGKCFINAPLTNSALVYSISVDIGDPPTSYNLVLSSVTANTWVGASTPYQQTPTSVNTDQPIMITYESGLIAGFVYHDTVTVGPGLTVIGQEIGVATYSGDDDLIEAGCDGVFGIGPVALTLDTLMQTPEVSIPTVTDNLFNQNIIPANILGVFFEPYAGQQRATTGQLTFGGTDFTLHIDDITYTPITNFPPALDFWGIDQNITYGGAPILENAVGIVDSSYVFIAIATEAFQLYQAATGGRYDPMTGLLVITGDQYNALQNLDFHISDQIFSLTPNAQIWPRALNTRISGQLGGCDIIHGYVFMQRFYTVFDATNSRVGFSQTGFTAATTN